jgi:hypothetical protein
MSIGYVKRDKLLATLQYAAMLSGTLSNNMNHNHFPPQQRNAL